MDVQTEQVGGSTVVRPVGDVDMSGSPDLRAAVRQALADNARKIVVDLSGVEYMDSSGLATLVEAMKNAKGASAELVLAAMHQRVRAIFEIARLDSYFSIVGSVDEACA